MDKNSFPLLLVEWEDITSHDEWNNLEDFEPAQCVSVGFELKSTKKKLIIGPTITDDSSGFGQICIPRGAIKRIKKLKT